MYPLFSNQYGSIEIPDEQANEWATLESQELRLEALKEFVLDVESPYEFWGMIFNHSGNNLESLIPRYQNLILGYIAENASRWNLDEVVCFLLEVATDHPRLANGAIQNIKAVHSVELVNLEYAGNILREILYQGVYGDVLQALCQEGNWRNVVEELVKKIGKAQFSQEYTEIFTGAVIEMLRNGVSSNVYRDAVMLVEGHQLFDQHQYFEAVESLLEFYYECPSMLSDQISLRVAQCFVELGWKGEALHWATIALNHNPNLLLAKDLQYEISAPYDTYIQRIKKEYARPYWTVECADVFATTDLLFRMHGRSMGDYGSIINGYGRSVEIQLRQKLLPRIRQWITEFGEYKEGRGHYCKYKINEPIYANVPEHKVTLGVWSELLNDENAYKKVDSKGEFFHCATRFNNGMWGQYEWSQRLIEYGQLINSFRELRNEGSHDSSRKWDDVVKTRELCLKILEGVPIKDGNLIG